MRKSSKLLPLTAVAFLSLLAARPLGAQVFTYTCSTAGGSGCRSQIPDAWSNGVTLVPGILASTITVPPGTCGGLLADIDLTYRYRHDWTGDLSFEIAPPTGAASQAGTGAPGDSRDDFEVTQPVFLSSFPSFTGRNPNGVWTLRATDGRNANVGALEDWTLSIVCQGASPSIPFVTITATDPNAFEFLPKSGTFTLTRSVVDSSPLVVQLVLGGTATASDYAPIPTTVTIPAGAASVTISVDPVTDSLVEPVETVVATLLDLPAYDPAGTGSAIVTIADTQADVPASSPLGLALLALTIAGAALGLLRGRSA